MADELRVQGLCAVRDGGANQTHGQYGLSEESIGGETGSFSVASSTCNSFDTESNASETSSTESEPRYCRLDWRAEMTPGSVNNYQGCILYHILTNVQSISVCMQQLGYMKFKNTLWPITLWLVLAHDYL